MNDLPSYGAFSQSVLMVHTQHTGEFADVYLKRALILFDKLVFIPFGIGTLGGRDDAAIERKWLARLAAPVANSPPDRLEDVLLLDRDIVDDVEGFRSSLLDSGSADLWAVGQNNKFTTFVRSLVYNDDTIHDKHEMEKFFIGSINYDCRVFRVVADNFSECTALLSELHEQAILATHGKGTPNPDTVVRRIGDLKTVDFGLLSWQDIFRLRDSDFVTDFRRKIAEWAICCSQAGDHVAAYRSIEQLIEDAKFEVIGVAEPNVSEAVLSGVGGNLPSPIGVNPISLFGAARDVAKQHRLKKEFGWCSSSNVAER